MLWALIALLIATFGAFAEDYTNVGLESDKLIRHTMGHKRLRVEYPVSSLVDATSKRPDGS